MYVCMYVYKIQVVTRRNDSRLNSHQRLQLQGWRANCDIQLVVDYQACVEYLAKYAAKSETRSHLLKNTFSAIVHNCQSTADATTMIKKTVMKTLGQKDFSAQETMHHLLSLNFVSSSFIVFPVNLNGSRRLNLSDAPDKEVTTDSLLDTYAQRDKYQADLKCNLTNMNFLEFATKYKLVSGKLVAQPKNLIPRVFPTYSSSIKSPNFGLMNYSLVSGKHSCSQSMPKTMFLIGMTNLKVYRNILILIYILKSILNQSNVKKG